MYVEIIGVITIFVALRALITRNRAEKLLYLNVIGFTVPALIALVIDTPFALIVAAVFFVCSTISSNAIAYSLKRLDDDSLHNHIVTKDIETQIKARHSITIKKGTIIQKVMGKDRIDVISLHRFVLPYINPNVTISAYSDDNVIEAIEYTKNDSLILGVPSC